MSKYSYKKESRDKNKVYFAVVVDTDFFIKQVDAEVESLAKKVKIPGFRPGKAPADVVRARVAEEAYINAFNRTIPEVTQEILFEESKSGVDFLSGIDYDFTLSDEEKQNPDGSVKYAFTAYEVPDVKYDHVSKVKFEYSRASASDEEVDDVIRNVIKSTLSKDEAEKLEEKFEITNDLVTKLGYEESKDVDSLRNMVRETLELQKNKEVDDKLAVDVLSWVIKENDFDLPQELIHREVERKHEEFSKRLEQLKMNEEDFLKAQGKTLDDMHKLWEDEVVHNIKSDIVSMEVAKVEKVEATDEDVARELDMMSSNESLKNQYDSDYGKSILRYFITRNNGLGKLIEKSGAKKVIKSDEKDRKK